MKALITGGTGFIGNNLARSFINQGHKVGLLIRRNSNRWRLDDLLEKVDFLEGDLRDKKGLSIAIENYHPDFIFHCGVYGAYPKKQKDIASMFSINVAGTFNLIEVLGGIPMINIGSSSEYGQTDRAMKENEECHPDDFYGLSKLTQTILCSNRGIPTLRLFTIYGPWDEPERLIPTLIESKLKGRKLHLINSVRDFIYVDDMYDAVLKGIKRYDSIKGEVINIGSGEQHSMTDILSELDRINPKRLDISWDFEAVQKEPKAWIADISKAKNVLDWQPSISFGEGLKRTYEWFKIQNCKK